MSLPNIKNNKYTPAPLPKIVAPRNELLARLDRSAEKKLIFISAPAGSGKTVSALLWIKKSNRKTVWIGLDVYDNSISIFYKMFCAGILSMQPDNDRMTEILLNPAFYFAPVEYTIMLLSEFKSDEGEYVLALDDFHTITNSEILKSLPYILRRLPHSFITLIMSRSEPEKYLSAYMQDKPAAVIGIDDLYFSTEEICEYFKARWNHVTFKEAEAAFAFTGGWAIAVNVLAQSAAPMPKGFGKEALDRYCKETIWDELDEDIRVFLIASAAIDKMPVALCKKITGRTDAVALLELLRVKNAFVTRIEDGVYRYHQLFLDFIRSQPEYIKMDKLESWREAAEYYVNNGELFVATYYACESKNIKTILDILYSYMNISEIPMYEYANNLRDLLYSEVMEELCEKYTIMYGAATDIFFIIGDVKNFEKSMDKFRQYLPLITLEYPMLVEPAVTAISLDYRTPIAELFAQFDELPSDVFQKDELKKVTYSSQLPFLHRGGRDFYDLTDKKTYDIWVKANERILKNHFKQIIHGTGAGLYLEQNRTNEALNEALKANGELTDNTAKEIRFSVYMHLAAVYLTLDNENELAELLDEIETFINEEAKFLLSNFLAFTSRVELWNGETAAAQEWLDHYFVNESELIAPYKLYQHFTTIRAFTVSGELEKAKTLAVRVRKMGKDFRRPQDAAEAGVLLAAILWAEDKKEESQEMMETVLSEMQPYSFIRLIADEGAAVLQVLKKILCKIEQANYHDLLDYKYVKSVYIAAYAVSKQRCGITAGLKPKRVKLSKNQKMVVQLLAHGHKRENIVEKTGISLNTVNTHIKIAYSKLGVSSAADAVVKARELGIIE
ncbi:MAG: LuxR C-terminal-related transcriptional regulator [Chitinispirillales bacterium]|jgi:LuxR family maltose regulon positive regulatory protein|nr:LuxR C-terminal-related transcriptional regulator [Chitinispirillales bacterium]